MPPVNICQTCRISTSGNAERRLRTTKDSGHPNHNLFSLLCSGRLYHSMRTNTQRSGGATSHTRLGLWMEPPIRHHLFLSPFHEHTLTHTPSCTYEELDCSNISFIPKAHTHTPNQDIHRHSLYCRDVSICQNKYYWGIGSHDIPSV